MYTYIIYTCTHMHNVRRECVRYTWLEDCRRLASIAVIIAVNASAPGPEDSG